MRFARALVLSFAVICAAGAASLVQKAGRATPPRPAESAPPEMVDILVAARPLMVGEMVGSAEVRWQAWPRQALPDGGIRRDPAAPRDALPFEPAPARFALLAGEPVAAAKLAGPGEGSALASLLAPGMRAVSVALREESAAGGVIQPGDRVDGRVMRRQSEGLRQDAGGEVLLRGVKVLAIGKALQGKATTAAAGGRTATLEVTPAQASPITTAQSGGEIALALIGLADASGAGAPVLPPAAPEVRLLKYGRSANRNSQP